MNTFNYLNYAANLELKRYSSLTEGIDPKTIVDDMKTNKGAKYPDLYKTLTDKIFTDIDAGKKSGDVELTHTDGTKFTVSWTDDGAKVTLTLKAAPAAATGGKNIDLNKIALVESPKSTSDKVAFVAALVAICIEKNGKDWGAAHTAWLKGQISILSKLGSQTGFGFLTDVRPEEGMLNPLKFIESPMNYINKLSGGDASLKERINNLGLSAVGSAKTDSHVSSVLEAISEKLTEDYISDTDEDAAVGAFYLISPTYDAIKLLNISKSSGIIRDSKSPVVRLFNEIDSNGVAMKAMLIWALGGLNYSIKSFSSNSSYLPKSDGDVNKYKKAISEALTA